MYDLIKMTGGKTDIRGPFWEANRRESVGKTLKYGGPMAKAKADKLNRVSDDYRKENPVYRVDSVNCAAFREAIVKIVK